jgi:hypothetical protein
MNTDKADRKIRVYRRWRGIRMAAGKSFVDPEVAGQTALPDID